MEKLKNYINGILTTPYSNNYINVQDPSTGETFTMIPDSNSDDVQLAVESAEKAFPLWSNLPAETRSEYLMKIAGLIKNNLEKFAHAESMDNGKPLWLSKSVDIPRAVKNFEFFASAITQFSSESHMTDNVALNYTLRQPLGIVGAISPWNLPLYLFSWKIAPALAAGNCVIAKPSEITPLTAFMLSEICIEAKLPKGVLNIIQGYGHTAGAAIVSHPKIKAITFTGGTKTGEEISKILRQCLKNFHWNSAEKILILFLQTAIMKKCLKLQFSHRSEIRVRFVCAGQEYLQKKKYMKSLKMILLKRSNCFA